MSDKRTSQAFAHLVITCCFHVKIPVLEAQRNADGLRNSYQHWLECRWSEKYWLFANYQQGIVSYVHDHRKKLICIPDNISNLIENVMYLYLV